MRTRCATWLPAPRTSIMLPTRLLVAELVAIDLGIVAGDRQIGAVAGLFEHVVREANVRRSRPDLRRAGRVGEEESIDLDVGGRRGHVEPVAARAS